MCAEGGFFMHKSNNVWGISNLSNLKIMLTVALFSTISFVFGKFLAIPVGDYMRFSFENLPIILGGVFFGPVSGCLCGIIADIVGCILRGYVINPVLTLGAAAIGFFSGFIFNVFKNVRLSIRITLSVIISHIIGSVIIKSIGLSVWYDMPFLLTFGMRTVNYIVVGVAELILTYILVKNKGFINQINRIKRR